MLWRDFVDVINSCNPLTSNKRGYPLYSEWALYNQLKGVRGKLSFPWGRRNFSCGLQPHSFLRLPSLPVCPCRFQVHLTRAHSHVCQDQVLENICLHIHRHAHTRLFLCLSGGYRNHTSYWFHSCHVLLTSTWQHSQIAPVLWAEEKQVENFRHSLYAPWAFLCNKPKPF